MKVLYLIWFALAAIVHGTIDNLDTAFVVLSLILAVRIDRKNNLKNIYNDENRQ